MAKLYIAIHKHEYGSTVILFKSEQPADQIFNALPDPDDWVDAEFDRIDFAQRLNLDFEPYRDETLEVQEVQEANYDILDFSDIQK